MSNDRVQISALQISTNRLLNWFLQRKSAVLNNEPDYVIGVFGETITRATTLYPTAEQTITIDVPLFKIPDDPKHKSIRQLATGLKKLTPDLLDAIIFSSVATYEVIPYWSDADALIIIKDEVFTDARRLWSLRHTLIDLERYLYEFDPWQHHGLQFITESDLRFYPETFLPIAALREAASFLHPTRLTLNVRDSTAEQERYFNSVIRLLTRAAAEGELKHHAKDGVYLQNNYATRENAFYQLKYFISVVLLLPSQFLGLVEQPLRKKESFAKIVQYFSPTELEFLMACEKTRLLFTALQPTGNAIPSEVEPVLGRDYFERAAAFALRLEAAYASH